MTSWCVVIEIERKPCWGKWTVGKRYAADLERSDGGVSGYIAVDNDGTPGFLEIEDARVVVPASPLPEAQPHTGNIMPGRMVKP